MGRINGKSEHPKTRTAKGAGLRLDGGKRPRLRAADARSWSDRKERNFFVALADTCNVKLAAERAGVSTSTIYLRRTNDASFRAGWDRALAEGYAKLEMVMLERALHGVEKMLVLRNGETSIMREYSDRLGLGLLRMHRDGAALANDATDPQDAAEAAERIMARLEKLARQQALGKRPGASESKGG